MTDLVNDECVVTDVSMLYSLPRFCLVHIVDSFANEGWFSSDQVRLQMCCWFVGKATFGV